MRTTNKKAIMGELRSLAMISAGMIAGSLGGKALDKALKVDENLPGFQAKKFVRPVALLGAGVLGTVKLKNQDLKMLSAGVGASGVVSTVKVVLKKDILNGLDGTPQMASPELFMPMTTAQSVFIESETDNYIESYEPNLPVLANYSEQEEYVTSEAGVIVTADSAEYEEIEII